MSALERLFSLLLRCLPSALRDRLYRRYSIPDVGWSLRNLRSNGFTPQRIIDVGAYRGEWTRLAKDIFPAASVLMIEPQRDKKAELDIVAGKLPDVDYASALVGAELRDSVSFHVNDTVSSVLPEKESTAAEQTTLPMTTLDRLTEGTRFEDPGFLKLDVQGYELEVLRGAESLLSRGNVEVLLMEVSLIEINEGAPLAADVLSFMDERGYQLYDICSFFRRPLDDALWQIDSIFVRKDSDLVASNRWQ